MTEQEAIKYLENQGYISDEVKEMAIKALEKQIPKKVVEFGICSDCCFDFGYKPVNHCPGCGQKLDRLV